MWGPFSDEDAGKEILTFTKDEMFPCLEDIRKLAVEVSGARLKYVEIFYNQRLRGQRKKYGKSFRDFLTLHRKWSTPDILYEAIKVNPRDSVKAARMMQDYMNSAPAVKPHLDEGFRLLNQIDKALTNQETASYNRITVLLSLLAITISIVTR